MKIELRKTRKVLPKGSINRIAEMCKKDQGYVSRFFKGKYEVTPDNEPIIDAAIKILEEFVKKENDLKDKMRASVNAVLELGK